MKFRSTIHTIAGATALVAAASPAFAGSTSTNMPVSATVNANCTVSADGMAFGPVNTLSASNTDATSTISVICTSGTAWTAAAGVGAGTGATLASRKMASSSGNLLNYSLYTDSARSTVWGTASLSGTGTGSLQTTTIYGRVPGGQGTVAPGTYTDTVAVTVTF